MKSSDKSVLRTVAEAETLHLTYYSDIGENLAEWAEGCGWDAERLRTATELAVAERHSSASPELESVTFGPTIYVLTLNGPKNVKVHYRREGRCVLVTGYSWDVDEQEPDDELWGAGGGRFVTAGNWEPAETEGDTCPDCRGR